MIYKPFERTASLYLFVVNEKHHRLNKKLARSGNANASIFIDTESAALHPSPEQV